jgi:hypothetical protein
VRLFSVNFFFMFLIVSIIVCVAVMFILLGDFDECFCYSMSVVLLFCWV